MLIASVLALATLLCSISVAVARWVKVDVLRCQSPNTALPFSRSALSHDDYPPITGYFSRREVKRCIEALDWYIESFGKQMPDVEIGRYEDLMYRFMSVPDSGMKSHALARAEDRHAERE